MNINLETGLIESNDDKDLRIETLASISVKELKTIGDNETLGALLVQFVHQMTSTNNNEGILIDKGLVDLLTKENKDEDRLMIGFKGENEPVLVVLNADGTMSYINKET